MTETDNIIIGFPSEWLTSKWPNKIETKHLVGIKSYNVQSQSFMKLRKLFYGCLISRGWSLSGARCRPCFLRPSPLLKSMTWEESLCHPLLTIHNSFILLPLLSIHNSSTRHPFYYSIICPRQFNTTFIIHPPLKSTTWEECLHHQLLHQKCFSHLIIKSNFVWRLGFFPLLVSGWGRCVT